MENKLKFGIYLIIGIWSLVIAPSWAAPLSPPRLINFQGRLSNASGAISTATLVTFKIYDNDGAELWSETKTITPANGIFNTFLGDATPFPAALDFSISYWVGVAVGGGPELSPRQRLVSVPYAFWARVADRAVVADRATTADSLAAGAATLTGDLTIPTRLKFNVADAWTGSNFAVIGLDAAVTKNLAIYDYKNNKGLFSIAGDSGHASLRGGLHIGDSTVDSLPASGGLGVGADPPAEGSLSVANNAAVGGAAIDPSKGLIAQNQVTAIVGRLVDSSRQPKNVYGALGIDPPVIVDIVPSIDLVTQPVGGIISPSTGIRYDATAAELGARLLEVADTKLTAGAYGQSSSTNYGYLGAETSGAKVSKYGVYGRSDSGTGVYGFSSSSVGLYGWSDNNYGVYGKSEGGASLFGGRHMGSAGNLISLESNVDGATKTRFMVDRWGGMVTDGRARIGTGAPEPGEDGLGVGKDLEVGGWTSLGGDSPKFKVALHTFNNVASESWNASSEDLNIGANRKVYIMDSTIKASGEDYWRISADRLRYYPATGLVRVYNVETVVKDIRIAVIYAE